MAVESGFARLKDRAELLGAFYRAAYIELTKSPSNVWISTAIQLFYYAAQLLFWLGVKDSAAGGRFISNADLHGFLITLGLVDNLYLCFLGPGSARAAASITEGALEPYLLWPRSPLAVMIFSRPNWSFLPCVLLSAAAAAVYYWTYGVGAGFIALHLAGVVCGVFVLNAISFIYRLTSFWTASIVQVRNSNPSFKIMVRPLGAFSGKLRLFLLTVFPALFITGVPAELLTGARAPLWLAAGVAAAGLLWAYVNLMWTVGVRRYGKLAT